jgi:hypothetical protein
MYIRKFLLSCIFVFITVFSIAQKSPKKENLKYKYRSYYGCKTYMDSVFRKAIWDTMDSLRVKKYLVN